MKKLLTLLLLATLFVGCSKDDEPTQVKNITKIEIENKSGQTQNWILSYKEDNIYKKVSSFILGYSRTANISIENLLHSDFYIFTDYASLTLDGKEYWRRIDTTYTIQLNEENTIQIPKLELSNLIVVDISDNTQFPKN